MAISAEPTPTDADLVTAARLGGEGGSRAYGQLVRRHERMVYALAASLVQPADVDDVVQNAFLRAFRNLDMLADPAKFGVWLRRIAFGAAIDHVRAERSRGDRSRRAESRQGGANAWRPRGEGPAARRPRKAEAIACAVQRS
jgi:RNA polymerase sigma factor (sigma-70 family)